MHLWESRELDFMVLENYLGDFLVFGEIFEDFVGFWDSSKIKFVLCVRF
jgi:hypothetical protein